MAFLSADEEFVRIRSFFFIYIFLPLVVCLCKAIQSISSAIRLIIVEGSYAIQGGHIGPPLQAMRS